MIDRTHLTLLRSERSALVALLASTPEDDVIDRSSLQAKLEQVEGLIAAAGELREPARALLTFSGRPVVGTHGIYADFAMKAVNGFAEAVAAVAASLTAPLAAMGPIPNREQNQLLITNTALGSFGFELEELPAAQLSISEQSAVEQAIQKTQEILIAAAAADDDALGESAAEVDQRAIDKIRAFVDALQANDALCALNFRNRVFRFASGAEVARASEQMSAANLTESVEVLEGQFVGALPLKRKSFEFRLHESGEVIVGRFAPTVSEPEEVNRHLHVLCSARFAIKRVGQGRPRYVLVELPEWSDSRGGGLS